MEEIRSSFGECIGKKIHKLDSGTIKQVNSEYDIESKMICKNCSN